MLFTSFADKYNEYGRDGAQTIPADCVANSSYAAGAAPTETDDCKAITDTLPVTWSVEELRLPLGRLVFAVTAPWRFVCAGAVLACLMGAAFAQDIELYVPASLEPRVMGLNEKNMREVLPEKLYMKHMVGPDMSVVLLDIRTGAPTPLNDAAKQQHYQGDEATRAATISGGKMPPMHQHGQEVAIVLEGEGKVVTSAGKEYPIRAGELIIMPPGLAHTGLFTSPRNLVLSITTPRRPEYGARDQAQY